MSKYITRKEIATEIEESVDVVRKNEKRWGLTACRSGFTKPVKYWRTRALAMLRQSGVLL